MGVTVTVEYTNTITSGFKPEGFNISSLPVTESTSLVKALEQIQSELNSTFTDLIEKEKHSAKIQKTE
ncbi:hypothetical protein LPJ64_001914 [Coemansia asiatica]|uniref:Uncharacterized protein n=1 Tax=Coemansia asiatica TaxID=1052880 RepID=A0A9W7XKI3_9FUNG|nr:hypothetical protein LPJ64_001914 [Coemansia asiatica]KAJ2887981.1 hypothetical protein FB639_000948 [Coemansia asiatica]